MAEEVKLIILMFYKKNCSNGAVHQRTDSLLGTRSPAVDNSRRASWPLAALVYTSFIAVAKTTHSGGEATTGAAFRRLLQRR